MHIVWVGLLILDIVFQMSTWNSLLQINRRDLTRCVIIWFYVNKKCSNFAFKHSSKVPWITIHCYYFYLYCNHHQVLWFAGCLEFVQDQYKRYSACFDPDDTGRSVQLTPSQIAEIPSLPSFLSQHNFGFDPDLNGTSRRHFCPIKNNIIWYFHRNINALGFRSHFQNLCR